MNFPVIKNISDVLPSLEGRNEFSIMEKEGGYTVIDYNYVESDSFNDPFRAECRGIIFDTLTGDTIRRPLEKFDNYGERFSQDKCEFDKYHITTDKRDGSMIAAFKLNGVIRFGTRAGITDHSLDAEKRHLKDGVKWFSQQLTNLSLTPIFEWTSPENRIVLDYEEDELRLLRIRNIFDGNYLPWENVKNWADRMDIQTTERFDVNVTPEWIEEQKRIGKGVEGFVVFWPHNQFSVKIKTDEYTQMHRAVSYFDRENMVLPIILDNQYDDLLPALSETRQEKVRNYAEVVWKEFLTWENLVKDNMPLLNTLQTRKDQALWIQANAKKELWPVYFRSLDGDNIRVSLKNAVLKNPETFISVRWN